MFPAYPQHIHTVLFTTYTVYISFLYTMCHNYCLQLQHLHIHTVPSRLALLFIYDMWYFSTITSQLTLQQYFQHILNIYIRYCLQLHYLVYWLCFYICYPFHNMIFFHNYFTIESTTMSTAYPQHIHIVLFTTTLHSILALLFTYAFLFTMWIFSTHYCTIVYMTMFTLNLRCNIMYCIQLLLPIY